MQQACEEVLRFAGEAAPNNLDKDLLRLRAIERSLAILGEAAKRVPMDFRERWPALQWRAITGLRDVLVHDYFGGDSSPDACPSRSWAGSSIRSGWCSRQAVRLSERDAVATSGACGQPK